MGDWRVTRAPDRGTFSQLTNDVCTYVQNQAPLSPVSHKSLSKISLCFCLLGEEVEAGGMTEGAGYSSLGFNLKGDKGSPENACPLYTHLEGGAVSLMNGRWVCSRPFLSFCPSVHVPALLAREGMWRREERFCPSRKPHLENDKESHHQHVFCGFSYRRQRR